MSKHKQQQKVPRKVWILVRLIFSGDGSLTNWDNPIVSVKYILETKMLLHPLAGGKFTATVFTSLHSTTKHCMWLNFTEDNQPLHLKSTQQGPSRFYTALHHSTALHYTQCPLVDTKSFLMFAFFSRTLTLTLFRKHMKCCICYGLTNLVFLWQIQLYFNSDSSLIVWDNLKVSGPFWWFWTIERVNDNCAKLSDIR